MRVVLGTAQKWELHDRGGSWILQVNDGVPGDTGSLDSVSLEVCGRPFEATPPEMRLCRPSREPGGVLLEWCPYPGLTAYRVYRASDPSSAGAFADVTSEDDDDGDLRFLDGTGAPLSFYLVTGVGPQGEGPKGHFGE